MRYLFGSKLKVFDAVVVVLYCIAYGHSLFATSIGGFWSGPDFDHPPMTGWSCLLSGWLDYPLGWLANPVLLTAVVLLLTRHRALACFVAMLAIGLAYLWTKEFLREFPAKLLKEGYHSWLMSMEIFVVGSFCSVAIHYGRWLAKRASRRSSLACERTEGRC